MNRQQILDKAASIVSGDRDTQYGKPENSFADIAALWTAYLEFEIQPEDVGHMMILLKIARTKGPINKADNYIDIAGYAACVAEFADTPGE